jgi:hypothetical protein
MATYYVRLDGNNDNAGTGYGTASAWATLAKAVSTVGEGDTVYIAPGDYRESITIATSGTLGNVISWNGDSSASMFIDLKPGYVRITGLIAGETGGSQFIININSKNYNEFNNLIIDGTTSNDGTASTITNGFTGTVFRKCIITGSYIALSGNGLRTTAYDCVFLNGYYGAYQSNCYNCLSIGGRNCFHSSNCYNSICIGGTWGFNSCPLTVNCSAYGSSIGFGVFGFLIAKNCTAFYCEKGFSGNLDAQFNRCKAISCVIGFAGASGTNKPLVTYSKYSHCGTGQDANTVGTAIECEYEGYTDFSKLMKIATAFKNEIIPFANWSSDMNDYAGTGANFANRYANSDYINVGTYNGVGLYQNIISTHLLFYSTTLVPNNWIIQPNVTVTPNEDAANYGKLDAVTPIGTYINVGTFAGTFIVTSATETFTIDKDILSHPRRMLTGILDCGAYEFSNLSLDFTEHKTFAPCIKIIKAGYKRIVIPVQAGVEKTISVWTKWTPDGGTLPPQLIISSQESILSSNPITITAIGDGSVYEQLTTTFTPTSSGLLEINFYSRNTQTNALVYFSDMQL